MIVCRRLAADEEAISETVNRIENTLYLISNKCLKDLRCGKALPSPRLITILIIILILLNILLIATI